MDAASADAKNDDAMIDAVKKAIARDFTKFTDATRRLIE
jgi:hypothetical protein